MAGGYFSNNGDLNGSGPFYVRFAVASATQDISGNFTWFNWEVWVGCSSNGWGTFGANGSWGVNLAGVGYGGAIPTLDFRPSGSSAREILVATGSTAVGHNADGTRPGFPNYASIDTDHSSIGDGSVTTWADANTIPRASTVGWSVPADQHDNRPDKTVTLVTNRASSSFTHDITWAFGTATGTVGTNITDSVSWTPPYSILNQLPNADTGVGNFTTKTYSGTTLIGSTTTPFRINVPVAIVPDFTTITNSEATAGVAANVGRYVQGISKLALAITGANTTGGYGSTIASYKIEVAGQTINAVSGTTPNPLATAGTYNITGTVTDSRGRTKTKTVSITVLPYAPPTINSVVVQRANSSGVLQDDGTYLKVSINASVQSLVNSTERNALVYRLSTRVRNVPPYVVKATTTPGGVTFNSSALISTYGATTSYDLLVEIIDDFSTSAQLIVVPTATFFMHWDGSDGVGFGKTRERGRIDSNGDIFFQRSVDDWRVVSNEGTAAQRNAIYGVPANDADKAALANKVVTWFNTETGCHEVYYATAGTTGLTVPGVLAGRPAGWYPISGRLPTLKIRIPTIGGIGNQRYRFRGSPAYWAIESNQIDGFTVNDTTGEITAPQIGLYEASWNAGQGTASGAALVIGVALNSTEGTGAPAGSVYDVNNIFGANETPATPGNYTFNSSPPKLRVSTTNASDIFTFWFGAGTGTTTIIDWGSRTSMKPSQYLALEYVRPPLVAR